MKTEIINYLQNQNLEEKISDREIAKLFNVEKNVIYRLRKKLNLENTYRIKLNKEIFNSDVEKGLSIDQLCEKHKCSVHTTKLYKSQCSFIKQENKKKLEIENEIVKEILKDKSPKEIKQKYNISASHFKYILKKHNLVSSYTKKVLENRKNKTPKKIADCKIIKDFTEIEKQVLIGGLLGDSTLFRKKMIQGAFRHSIKQESYGDYKYELLKRLCGNKHHYETYNKTVNKHYQGVVYYIKSHEPLEYYYNLFYKEGKKVINSEIVSQLDGLGLAIWFMDDGSKNKTTSDKQKGSYRIATNCFEEKDLRDIIPILKEKFGFYCTINFDGVQPILRISSKTSDLFTKAIIDYIPESMMYKIHTSHLK
jgi:transposase